VILSIKIVEFKHGRRLGGRGSQDTRGDLTGEGHYVCWEAGL